MKYILRFLLVALCLAGCGRKPYVIVQIADAQLGFTAADESQRNGTEYVNDLSYEVDCLTKAVALVNEIGPDAVVFTGDQVNLYGDKEQWDTFDSIISGLDKEIKVFHVPGNHDVIIRGDKVDPTPFTDRYGPDRFSHSERGVKLVGINTSLIKYDDGREVQQMEWLRETLKKDSPREVSLVFGHHPFFMTDINEEDGYFQISPQKRHEYFDMFAELGVNAVYAGHRHSTFEAEYNGIPMKTMTAAGVQLGPDKPAVRVITVSGGEVSDKIVEL